MELKTSDYRYERKFLVSEMDRSELEMVVRLHPAIFRGIFHPRFVNNIYLDTIEHASYTDTIEGNRDRIKARIRWYDDLFGDIEKPVLELKIKRGFVGSKVSFPLAPFSLDQRLAKDTRDTILQVFHRSDMEGPLLEYVRRLEPTLLNRYLRTYYQSADRNFRITVDSDLEYYALFPSQNTFLLSNKDRTSTVLELKYAIEQDRYAPNISRYFPFQLTKSSKYVMGLASLYSG